MCSRSSAKWRSKSSVWASHHWRNSMYFKRWCNVRTGSSWKWNPSGLTLSVTLLRGVWCHSLFQLGDDDPFLLELRIFELLLGNDHFFQNVSQLVKLRNKNIGRFFFVFLVETHSGLWRQWLFVSSSSLSWYYFLVKVLMISQGRETGNQSNS